MTEKRRLETAAPAMVMRMMTFSRERRFFADSSLRNASSDMAVAVERGVGGQSRGGGGGGGGGELDGFDVLEETRQLSLVEAAHTLELGKLDILSTCPLRTLSKRAANRTSLGSLAYSALAYSAAARSAPFQRLPAPA